MIQALPRDTWNEGTADSEGIGRFWAMPILKHFRKCIGCNVDLTNQLSWVTHSQQVNVDKVPLRTDAIVNVGEVTYELIHAKSAREIAATIRPGKQAHVESMSRTVNERSAFIALNEHPSAVAAPIGVALQRSTPAAGPISATTVSETSSEGEECPPGQTSLAGEGNPKLALLKNMGGGDLFSVLNQVGDFVGKFFDLLGSLARIAYRERNCDGDELILRTDLVVAIGESVDGPSGRDAKARVQRDVERFSIRPIDHRCVPSQPREWLSAVSTFLRVPQHSGAFPMLPLSHRDLSSEPRVTR